jgi:membrane protease YdiL (CAAX protease family)
MIGALDPDRIDRRAVVALLAAALAGVLANHFANVETWRALAPGHAGGVRGALWGRAWQTSVLIAVYVLVPLVAARAVGVRPLELGLRWGDSGRFVRVYALVLAVCLPIAFALSFTTGFRHVYPVFAPAVLGGRAVFAWLPLFAVMLFAVELFFRGFLLAMLRPALGRYALFVMVVPYALTHADFVEALGAIGVGLLLGLLALRSRSIWIGWLTHVSIAFCVEALAIWQARRH